MEYVPIRVSTLRGDQKISFNLFVRINEKYILYIREGDSFEGNRLVRLKEKKLRKMFIVPEHEDGYRRYLTRNIEVAYDDKTTKTLGERSEIIQGVQQSHAEDVMENPENETSYNLAKEGTDRYVKFLLKENKALEAMLNIENTDKNIGHHGVNVATLGTALAQRLGYDDKQKQMLALGALLHDIGHLESNLNFARPISEFSKDELNIYKQHPERGATKVKDLRHFDAEVIRVILQHEECADGAGFPSKLRETGIDPIAMVVGSANAFDRLLSFEGKTRQEATKSLLIDKVARYPLKHIQLIQSIMKDMRI